MKTHTPRILVADDDTANNMLLRALLEEQGYEVLSAANGQEAVDLYRAELPDMVLMDVKMPIMDGYEAAQQIKSIPIDGFVPLIFLTAMTEEEGLVKCIESGGDDFFI